MQVLAVCPTCSTAGLVTPQQHTLDEGGAFAALDTLYCTNPACITANNGTPPTTYISFDTTLTPEQVRANNQGGSGGPDPDPDPGGSDPRDDFWRYLLDRLRDRRR